MRFKVQIDPEIPILSEHDEIDFSKVDVNAVAKASKEEYNIRYHIGDEVFEYYPSTILTVLNDLYLELCSIWDRKSHDVTICGYTVLKMNIDGDCAIFIDPVCSIGFGEARRINGEFSLDKIELEMSTVTKEVYNFVRNISERSSTNS